MSKHSSKKKFVQDGPNDEFWRQRAFYSPDRHAPKVLVVGAGGIGSNLVYQLTKLGVKDIVVYDHDYVSTHNISTTMYTKKHVAKPKVQALQSVVGELGGKIKPVHKRFTGHESLKGFDIVISATDSLAARKVLFDSAVKQKVPFLIDGRIGGEKLRVYALQPTKSGDRKYYRKTFVPAHMIMPLPCVAQGVIDVSWFCTSLMTRVFRTWVTRGRYMNETVLDLADLSSMFLGNEKSKHTPPPPPKEKTMGVPFQILPGAMNVV